MVQSFSFEELWDLMTDVIHPNSEFLVEKLTPAFLDRGDAGYEDEFIDDGEECVVRVEGNNIPREKGNIFINAHGASFHYAHGHLFLSPEQKEFLQYLGVMIVEHEYDFVVGFPMSGLDLVRVNSQISRNNMYVIYVMNDDEPRIDDTMSLEETARILSQAVHYQITWDTLRDFLQDHEMQLLQDTNAALLEEDPEQNALPTLMSGVLRQASEVDDYRTRYYRNQYN